MTPCVLPWVVYVCLYVCVSVECPETCGSCVSYILSASFSGFHAVKNARGEAGVAPEGGGRRRVPTSRKQWAESKNRVLSMELQRITRDTR